MIILPADRKIDLSNPPVLTLALVLINCFVFFFLQGGDRHDIDAYFHYMESDLPQIEFPARANWLEAQDRRHEALEVRLWLDGSPPPPEDDSDAAGIFFDMQVDGRFRKALLNDEIITPAHPEYDTWQLQRAEVESIMDRWVSWRYGFRPAEPSVTSLFSHMFLHSNFMHLLGNMVFLLIVGYLVEMALGRRAFIGAYVLGGVAAVSLHWLLNLSSAVPLVGASGAISAIMGAFAVIYGLRRIRFFYSILFYFGFVRAPALIMLPLWVGIELFRIWNNPESNIAYFAHIGGFLGGALIAGTHRSIDAPVNTEFMDAPAQEDESLGEHARAMALVERLRLEEARPLLQKLHEQDPGNQKILRQLYAVTRFRPDSEAYHEAAGKILSLPETDPATVQLVHNTFRDYLKRARPGVRIPPEQYTHLAQAFVKGGYLEEAENIIRLLLKRPRASRRLPNIILQLARARHKARAAKESRAWLQLLAERFAGTEDGQQAEKMLQWHKQPQE